MRASAGGKGEGRDLGNSRGGSCRVMGEQWKGNPAGRDDGIGEVPRGEGGNCRMIVREFRSTKFTGRERESRE